MFKKKLCVITKIVCFSKKLRVFFSHVDRALALKFSIFGGQKPINLQLIYAKHKNAADFDTFKITKIIAFKSVLNFCKEICSDSDFN